MASTMAKVAVPKIKKPPPPLQTPINGLNSSKSSLSPLLSSKRTPSVQNHPPNSASSTGPIVNGTGPRASNRQRRESYKPGDVTPRSQRNGSLSTRAMSAEMGAQERLNLAHRDLPRPYVITTPFILKKFHNVSPSLILHLHQQNFKFDQQDGAFAYTSPMKVMLEHIRAGTIPHDLMEEFYAGGVQFYDGRLIVQIHDHRSNSASPENYHSAKSAEEEKNAPFSIHKHNEHLTPSPYVPFTSQSDKKTPPPSQNQIQPLTEQRNGSAPSNPKAIATRLKSYTTVLHPTALSYHAEKTILAMTPLPIAQGRRSSQQSQPPTPLTAGPLQPPPLSGPPAKRQKTMLNEGNFLSFEADLIKSVSAPLFLEPVKNMAEAEQLFEALKDPLHTAKPPTRKTRKRTTAELAADEAQAAKEAEYMLIYDERLGSTEDVATGGVKSGVADAHAGAAMFNGNFSRLKTMVDLKAEYEKQVVEKDRREREAREQEAQRRHEEAEKVKAENQRRAVEQARLNTQRAQQAAQQAQTPVVNGVLQNVQQSSQPPRSSPVVRNGTPHNLSSPSIGHSITAQGGVPMHFTSSGGGGSPIRHPAAIQHGVAQPMIQQRSQQGGSRHGTPHNSHATPAIPHSTPIIRNSTPTSRLNANVGSPVPTGAVMNGGQANGVHMVNPGMQPGMRNQVFQVTPQQAAQMQNSPHMNGGQQIQQMNGIQMGQPPTVNQPMLTPQQQQQQQQIRLLMQQQHQQQQQQQQQQQRNGGQQPGPRPNQMATNGVQPRVNMDSIIRMIVEHQQLVANQWRQTHPGQQQMPQEVTMSIANSLPGPIRSLPQEVTRQALQAVINMRRNQHVASYQQQQQQQQAMVQRRQLFMQQQQQQHQAMVQQAGQRSGMQNGLQ
ncbi:MAG: Transcription factor spt20 [Vezdaea aestivalis]|nr:MAG: Transcription factor spt20 [Vezdaea aestivalis]